MFRWRAVFCNRAWPQQSVEETGRRKGTEAQKQEQMGTRKRTSRSIETLIQHSNPDNNLYTSSYTRVCYYQRESTLYYAQYELVVRIILLLEYAYYSTSICICIKYAYYPYTARQCYAYYIMYAQYPYYLVLQQQLLLQLVGVVCIMYYSLEQYERSRRTRVQCTRSIHTLCIEYAYYAYYSIISTSVLASMIHKNNIAQYYYSRVAS